MIKISCLSYNTTDQKIRQAVLYPRANMWMIPPMSQAKNKTVATDTCVETFLSQVTPDRRRKDAHRLNAIFQDITGWPPTIWGSSIIGYGSYHYRYKSGREGDFLATGFAPRKANLSIYIMPGYQDYSDILHRLGKHKIGKSCLYINTLADVDEAVLTELITAGLKDLGRLWPVTRVSGPIYS